MKRMVVDASKLSYTWDGMSKNRKAKCFEEFCGYLFEVDSKDLTSDVLSRLGITEDQLSGETPMSVDEEAACFDDVCRWLLDYPSSTLPSRILKFARVTKDEARNLGFDDEIVDKIAASSSIEGGDAPEGMSFKEWLNWTYYEGFDPSGLSDEEYYELEDEYQEYLKGCSAVTGSYIPDMTERYPEGLDGVDMYAPYDAEAKAWDDFERQFREEEQRTLDYFNNHHLDILKQDSNGWTLAEAKDEYGNDNLLLCTIKNGQIIDIEDMARNIPANWDIVYRLYYEGLHRKEKNIQCSKAIMADVWDEISQVDQEFTSENTSINSNKLPAIFKMIKLPEGSINLDFGGGRFDNVAEYLEPLGVINLVYDPYNRSAEHNQEVIKTLKEAGGADSATCSNVLNVIKEPEARLNVLKNISKMVKPGGDIYITVYEGTGKGDEGETKSGYQLNRKTADYVEEIQQVFPNAERKGKLIVATN